MNRTGCLTPHLEQDAFLYESVSFYRRFGLLYTTWNMWLPYNVHRLISIFTITADNNAAPDDNKIGCEPEPPEVNIERNRDEWEHLAKVTDRVLFVVGMVSVLSLTVIFFMVISLTADSMVDLFD